MLLDLGLQRHRLDGDEYLAVIDEFMEAVFTRWPHVIVQVIRSVIHLYLVTRRWNPAVPFFTISPPHSSF